jgi:hypothetical protein
VPGTFQHPGKQTSGNCAFRKMSFFPRP